MTGFTAESVRENYWCPGEGEVSVVEASLQAQPNAHKLCLCAGIPTVFWAGMNKVNGAQERT